MSDELAAWLRDPSKNSEEVLRALVRSFVRTSPANRLRYLDDTPIYDEPLVAYADGDDPLFDLYKTAVGPFHLTPRQVWQSAPAAGAAPARLSVIAYILPISQATRESNRAQEDAPSARWAHTRTYGEHFNDVLRRYIVQLLQVAGYWAVAPVLSPGFRTLNEGIDRAPASTWSERHVMYAAGLGTFGLSDGFITPRGDGHALRQCGDQHTAATLAPVLRQPHGQLPVPFAGALWRLHRPLPCRSNHHGRARQEKVPGLCLRHAASLQGALRRKRGRLRPLPDGRALRVSHPEVACIRP